MKRFYLLAAALLAFASCSNEELVKENITTSGVIRANFEQGASASRLAIGLDNGLTWTSGDCFVLFSNDATYYYTTTEGGATASFSGTAPTDGTYQGAAFPASNEDNGTDNPSYSNGTITMTLPGELDQETAGNCNLPMWAEVTSLEGTISFKHLAGVLRVNLSDIPEGYNQLTVTASNPISGKFTIEDESSAKVLKAKEDNSDAAVISTAIYGVTVTFTATTDNDAVVYIPLPVGTYQSISVSISNGIDNPKNLVTWSNKTVERAKIYTTSLTYQEVNASTPSAVSSALNASGLTTLQLDLTETIDATGDDAGEIEVPETITTLGLNFAASPTTSSEKPLVIKSNEDATSGTATQNINIDMPEGESDSEGVYLEIKTPTSTVTLNGGNYKKITATTATNTLIIGEGVTIDELVINGGNVKLEGDLTLTKPLAITTETTIDLNGHNIQPQESFNGSDALILVHRGGNLTITDGSEEGAGRIDTGDKEEIYGAIKMTDVSDSGEEAATLTVDGGTIKGYYYGIMGNGGRHNTEITISGGTIEAGYCAEDNTGIFHPQSGTLTISGGSITGYKSAVEMRAGELTISDGTFTSTATEEEAEANANGNTITGAAIAVSQHITNKELKVTISNGIFNGVYAIYEADQHDDVVDDISLSVTGGTFNGSIYTENCLGAITGGTFSDPSACYFLGTNANVTVDMKEDYTGAGFKTQSGQTVTMTIAKDKTYTVTAPLVGSVGTQNLGFQFLQGSNVTINGSGTITSSDAKMLINNYADLTLKGVTLAPEIPTDDDSTTDYNEGMKGQAYYVLSNNCGTVNIEGGTTITAPTSTDTNNCPTVYAFDVCKYLSYPNVTVNVKDATISGDVEYTGTEGDKQKLNITDGTITGNLVVGDNYEDAASTGITISGGTQTGEGWDVYKKTEEDSPTEE